MALKSFALLCKMNGVLLEIKKRHPSTIKEASLSMAKSSIELKIKHVSQRLRADNRKNCSLPLSSSLGSMF